MIRKWLTVTFIVLFVTVAPAYAAWGNPVYIPNHNWGIMNDEPAPPDYPQGNPPVGTPDPWTLPGDTVIGDEEEGYWINVQDPELGGWIWVPVHFGVNFTLYDTNNSSDDYSDPSPPDDNAGIPPSDYMAADDPCLTAPYTDGCSGGS